MEKEIKNKIHNALLNVFKDIREGDIEGAWDTYDKFYDILSPYIDIEKFTEDKNKIIFCENE